MSWEEREDQVYSKWLLGSAREVAKESYTSHSMALMSCLCRSGVMALDHPAESSMASSNVGMGHLGRQSRLTDYLLSSRQVQEEEMKKPLSHLLPSGPPALDRHLSRCRSPPGAEYACQSLPEAGSGESERDRQQSFL